MRNPSPFRGQHILSQNNLTIVEQTPGLEPLPLDQYYRFVASHHKPLHDATAKLWDFLPTYIGHANLEAPPLAFSTPCFQSVSLSASLDESDSIATLRFHCVRSSASPPPRHDDDGLLCADSFVLTTDASVHFETIRAIDIFHTHTVRWSGLSPLELDDVRANGFRLFRSNHSLAGTLASAVETALLFTPAATRSVSRAAAERNIKFMRARMPGGLNEYSFTERDGAPFIPPAPDEVNDGDVFVITRLDGLDPMINWGTGGSSGHMVMALRLEGELHIVESQVKGAYWPKDFVQRNTYKDWLAYARAADYNVLHLRLNAASRARFNASAAAATFASKYEGLMYGFPNMLWGWFDGPSENFPPPLDVHLVGTLFSVLDPMVNRLLLKGKPSLWNGAIAQRLGVPLASTAELLDVARGRGLSFGDLLRMPERDSWTYSAPPVGCGRTAGCDGPAQVCNVFVCKMLRAAGVFDVYFDCGEQTPLDTYSMDIFDRNPPLSPACKKADPMNTMYCQIMGRYRLQLPHFSSVKPHSNMSVDCPSMAPNYTKRFDPAVAESC